MVKENDDTLPALATWYYVRLGSTSAPCLLNEVGMVPLFESMRDADRYARWHVDMGVRFSIHDILAPLRWAHSDPMVFRYHIATNEYPHELKDYTFFPGDLNVSKPKPKPPVNHRARKVRVRRK